MPPDLTSGRDFLQAPRRADDEIGVGGAVVVRLQSTLGVVGASVVVVVLLT